MSSILFELLLRRSNDFEIKMFRLLKFNGPQILMIALGSLENSSSVHIRNYFLMLFEVNFLFQISFVLICFYGCYFLFPSYIYCEDAISLRREVCNNPHIYRFYI